MNHSRKLCQICSCIAKYLFFFSLARVMLAFRLCNSTLDASIVPEEYQHSYERERERERERESRKINRA